MNKLRIDITNNNPLNWKYLNTYFLDDIRLYKIIIPENKVSNLDQENLFFFYKANWIFPAWHFLRKTPSKALLEGDSKEPQ